jgi:SAM-dependent methyltransferase
MSVESRDYEPREYWSQVARAMAGRAIGPVVAGDDTPFFRLKRAVFVRRFLRTLPVKGKAVLEIGCGAGANLVELHHAGPRKLVGCDISPEMAELARGATRGLTGISIVELTDGDLPFSPHEFDVTFTVTVLHHNHDAPLVGVVAEACRVTRERLYLFEDTATTKDVRHSYVLRPVSEYAELCSNHGFQLVESEPLGLYASWLVSGAVRTALNPAGRHEGEPVGRLNWALEERLLPLTRLLDRVVPQRTGLMKMSFVRDEDIRCQAR